MRNRRVVRVLVLAALVAAVAAIAAGGFFFYRDSFSTHLPYRAALAAHGPATLWNPYVGGGQPLAGNPNAVAFYPDAVLYALLPLFPAFNLHFLVHWMAGAVAMYALLRRREVPPEAAAFGAALWVSSGAAVSTLAFYNLVTAVALVPLALWAAAGVRSQPGWRSALPFGAAFGLLALAGEPVVLLGTAIAAAVLILPRASRRVIGASGGALFVAALVALPLLVAWSAIASETERGARAFSAETVLAASLTPWQIAEMILGPVRGLATDPTPSGWAASGAASGWPPLFLSLHLGAIAVPALLAAPRRFRREQIATAVLLALALGRFNPAVAALVASFEGARLLRYPEKLALPAIALLVVLATAWLAKERRSRADRLAAGAGAVGTALLALAALAAWSDWSSAMRVRIGLGAAVALPVFALAAMAVSPLARRAIAAATLAASAGLAVWIAPVDRAAPYRDAPSLASALAGHRIARVTRPSPPLASARAEYRRAAERLDPVWGSAFGVAYVLDRSPDGMYSFLSRIAHERFRDGAPAVKARWARLAAAELVLSDVPLAGAGFRRVDLDGAPDDLFVYAVRDPLPLVFAPGRVIATASINEAVERLESPELDPRLVAVAPPGHARHGVVHVISARRAPGRWTLEVRAEEEGTVLVGESWFRAWNAVDQDGRRLRTFPLNLDRLGVAVPAGTTRIELTFGRRGAVASAWIASSASLLLALLAPAWWRRRE